MTHNPYSDLPGKALEEREEPADMRLMRSWCEQQEQIQFSEACKPLPEHLPPDDPTESQVHGACMWFRHDYGLLERDVRVELQSTARGWLAAWQKVFGGD